MLDLRVIIQLTWEFVSCRKDKVFKNSSNVKSQHICMFANENRER